MLLLFILKTLISVCMPEACEEAKYYDIQSPVRKTKILRNGLNGNCMERRPRVRTFFLLWNGCEATMNGVDLLWISPSIRGSRLAYNRSVMRHGLEFRVRICFLDLRDAFTSSDSGR